MRTSLKLGAAVAGIAAVVALTTSQVSSNRAADAALPSGQPTAPLTAVPATTATPTEAAPPSPTLVFTSTRYGLSIGYPEGWKTTPGRVPWTMPATEYREPLGDLIEDPTHEFLWIKLASQPLGDTTFDDWYAGVFEGHGCGFGTHPVTIDGVPGFVNDSCHTALVASGGRGYLIGAHLCPCELADLGQWDTWFIQLLTTVQLDPQAAIDPKQT